jgi:hypothetical protein
MHSASISFKRDNRLSNFTFKKAINLSMTRYTTGRRPEEMNNDFCWLAKSYLGQRTIANCHRRLAG